jgi:hypothetical protein
LIVLNKEVSCTFCTLGEQLHGIGDGVTNTQSLQIGEKVTVSLEELEIRGETRDFSWQLRAGRVVVGTWSRATVRVATTIVACGLIGYKPTCTCRIEAPGRSRLTG